MKGQQTEANQHSTESDGPAPEETADVGTLELSELLARITEIKDEDTLAQLKGWKSQTDQLITRVTQEITDYETQRNNELREIGNLLDPAVPISDNEDKQCHHQNIWEHGTGETWNRWNHRRLEIFISCGLDYNDRRHGLREGISHRGQPGLLPDGSRCLVAAGFDTICIEIFR